MKHVLFRVFFTFAIFVMMLGCKSTVNSGLMLNTKGYYVERPIFEIKGVRLSDSTVQLSFIAPSSLRAADKAIRYVYFFVGPDEDHLHDSIMANPLMAGAPGVHGEILFLGEGVWDSQAARASSRAVIDVNVVTRTDHAIFRSVVEYREAEPVDILGFAIPVGSSGIDVGVLAKRIYMLQGEYLPTSESFRVLITDGKRNLVWRSDAGLAFLSVVTAVEPQATNAVHRYVMPWDGVDLGGQKVPEGEYTADLIIPSRPKPYATSIKFMWPPR